MTDAAKWICHPLDGDENRLIPVFRRRFTVGKDLKSAELRLTAHGVYETEINGRQVTKNRFTPGLTSYYYRIQVQAYDVTGLLREGENVWQTTVGDGWWRWHNNFGYRLALWGILELRYADDSIETIGTDESFEAGTGPVVKSDLQKGETFDARIAEGNWMHAALENGHIDAALIPSQGVPVREKEHFPGHLFRDSLNHYSLGAVCQFLFEYVAGIRPTFDAPGFREFELKPVPGGSLTWAEGEYNTKYGRIVSGWKIEKNTFFYHCTVPEKTKAHLRLPDGRRRVLGPGTYTVCGTMETAAEQEDNHGKI